MALIIVRFSRSHVPGYWQELNGSFESSEYHSMAIAVHG